MAPARPTILQIIPTLDTGGAELSTVEIAHAIVAGGGRALVATSGGRLAPRIIEAGGEIIPFPADTKNPARMIANARSLAGLIRRENVDLVHARSRAPAWSAFSAARATKRPFVTTYHGAYSENGPLKRAYNSVMARGSPVIANSEFTASLIASRYGTPPGNIRIIHRGVDPSAFDPTTIPAARLDALRHYLGLAPGQPMILHPARLTRWKGQPILIEALALLGQHGDTPPAITKIREWLPKIELNIKIDTSSVLARDLLSSRLDFIVARIPDDADPRLFDCLSIGPEQACLIVRGGHPLLAKSPVNLQQLSKFDWVMQARGTPLRRAIDNLFLAGNVALPERVLNTSSLLLTMILVAQSNAIAPISFEAAKFAAGGGGAGALEILPARFTVVLQPYSLISVRNRAMSPAAQSVFGLIRKQARI